jgi:hypothetical protein
MSAEMPFLIEDFSKYIYVKCNSFYYDTMFSLIIKDLQAQA